MFGPSASPRGSRTTTPLVLFVILLVTVAIAWSLSYWRGLPARRGARILGEIRTNGLSKYWTPYEMQWFLISNRRGVVGWSARVRVRREDGNFEGLNVYFEQVARGIVGHWEWWMLNDQGHTGQYEAGQLRFPWGLLTDTRIHLKKDVISATQVIDERLDSHAPTPENYVPEGMLTLVLRELGRGQVRGQFKMIVNSVRPIGDLVNFQNLRAERVESVRTESGETQSQISVRYPGSPGMNWERYFFDEKGKLARRVGPDKTFSDATLPAVTLKFPQATQIFAKLLQIKNVPLPKNAPKLDDLFDTDKP